MVWYNSEENKLMYSYNTTPTTKEGRLGASKAGWATISNNEWKTDGSGAPLTLIPNAGEYCQLVVDGNNGIHVVAYDSGSGDLKYAYLSSYNDASPKVCTVDSYLDVGTQLSLDVAAETKTVNGQSKTCYIPHIGYWASYPEKPRYAYLYDVEAFEKSSTEAERSGAISGNDKYTGIWECGILPAAAGSDVKEGKVNIALWKKDVDGVNGKRVASTSGTSYANNDEGKCYGNGTDNAVLAYVVMPSSSTYHIETAQIR